MMMKYLLTALLFTGLMLPASAQEYTETEIVQGYRYLDGEVTFLFDAALNGLGNTPERVVVTGSFRGWSEDMDDPDWQLTLSDGLWSLTVANPNLKVIPPNSEFKFRVNEGEWLLPPSEALNAANGNLIFLYGVTPPGLRAEFRDAFTIWAEVEGIDRPLEPSAYRLMTHDGTEIALSAILPNTETGTLISTADPVDFRRPHYLEIPDRDLKTPVSYDGWFRRLYSDKLLGAHVDTEESTTTFRLFAPRANRVRLMLYRDKTGAPYDSLEMVMDVQGVWERAVPENLKGVWYDFKVFGPKEPGSHFYGEIGETVSDPYALVNDDAWGRSRVWVDEAPPKPLADGIPAMEDVIAYEVHVQDFTDRLPVADSLKGTFPAMIAPGLTNSHGEPIGFDYVTDLGINVVHLMPVQEYLHYPDDLWKASFASDSFMQAHGIATENYQWGYRTTHALAVENRYRAKGTEHGAEREQFRRLVEAFHEKGIAVIIDIVPNHTGENMDKINYYFNFNGIDKSYYYRTDNFDHIGEYGNEVKTENRPMVQRWLIDQCLHFIETFGVDGFRIDLAGQIDEQTLKAIKKAIGEDKILYGEPWIGSNDPEYEGNPAWDWYKVDSPITFFQDDARNAFKGSAFFNVENPDREKERGFAGGNEELRERVMLALQNYFPEEDSPLDGINYLDIHDNWALADQFASQDWDGSKGVLEDRVKLAALLLFTSQGPLVLHGGTEMLRSKGSAELKETVKEMNNGTKVYLHGKRDTYNMRIPNQFVWENVGLNKGENGSANNYEQMIAFWKDLIALRRSELGTIFRNANQIPEGFYQFVTPYNAHLLGYFINEELAVLMNTGNESDSFIDITFPPGEWEMIGNLNGIDSDKHITGSRYSTISGGKKVDITVGRTSFFMWRKE